MKIKIRKLMSIYLVYSCLSILFISQTANAITEEKTKDILVLFKAMDIGTSMSKDMAEMGAEGIIKIEKSRHPDLPKKAELEISQFLYEAGIKFYSGKNIEQILLPIYDKYYTHDEIKALTTFFNSPIGKKYSAVNKPMTLDMMEAFSKRTPERGKEAQMQVSTIKQILKKYGYK